VSVGKVGASAPPSISMIFPVMWLAAGDASHLAVLAMSATVLSLRSGVAETIRCRRSSLRTVLRPSVCTTPRAQLDLPGAVLVSASMFCLVYGFSNAASHSWHTPSTYGFLAAGAALLAVFAFWQSRAASPLLPPRVVLDRNRGGAYLAVLIVGAGMFGIFLFLTYYLQQTLGYSPVVSGVAFLPLIAMVVVSGVAFLPLIAMVVVSANLSNVVLLPGSATSRWSPPGCCWPRAALCG
jgi:hypothetical protein